MTEQKSEYKAESGAIYPIKLVICDVDGTCVKTKSGNKFRRSADDWQWIDGRKQTQIEKTLREERDGQPMSPR